MTFPAPSHLVLAQRDVSGNSLCIFESCPSAHRYYVSQRTAEATCSDLMQAVGRWDGAEDVRRVEGYDDEHLPCFLAGTYGGAHLGVSVFDADRLLPTQLEEIPLADRDRYRTAATVSLDATGRPASVEIALWGLILLLVGVPVGIALIGAGLLGWATTKRPNRSAKNPERVARSRRLLLAGGIVAAPGTLLILGWIVGPWSG